MVVSPQSNNLLSRVQPVVSMDTSLLVRASAVTTGASVVAGEISAIPPVPRATSANTLQLRVSIGCIAPRSRRTSVTPQRPIPAFRAYRRCLRRSSGSSRAPLPPRGIICTLCRRIAPSTPRSSVLGMALRASPSRGWRCPQLGRFL